jgi:hypothetical protein
MVSSASHMYFDIPSRQGATPEVGQMPPQLQYSDLGPETIRLALYKWCFSIFPAVRERDTLVSVPTTRAMWLDSATPAIHEDAFMPPEGSREFCHLHLDGSLHAVLDHAVEEEVLNKHWGLRHMYYHNGVKETLIFAPRDELELKVIKRIIIQSYVYAAGSSEVTDSLERSLSHCRCSGT